MGENSDNVMAVHGGEVFRLAAQAGIEPDCVIDFSANINPLGLPPGVGLALREALQNLANYPEIDAESLRLCVAERHKLNIDNVIVGNGSSALIYLLTRVFKPKKSLIWSPTFTEYERALRQVQSEVVNLECFDPEKKLLLDEIIEKTKEAQPELVFLCNPNNPTGLLWSIAELEKIISALCKSGIICVLDEAFIDFVGEGSSFAARVNDFDNLIVLRSLTKIYALAGIRCGYLLSGRSINQLLGRFLEPWSTNTLALKAAVTALENDHEFIKETISFVAKERNYLTTELRRLNYLRPFPASANYILTKVNHEIDCEKLRDYLFARDNILIRLCGDYVGLSNNFVRFAVKNEVENRKLVEGLSEYQSS
ncbi:threonine-phosphate decarboxylase [bacterium]|nr:threonine-phosphate decarboxylase [bacterium]